MNKDFDDLLAELRSADPAADFHPNTPWISHRLADLLEEDPAFYAPLPAGVRSISERSPRPKLNWIAGGAAAVLLLGGGYFAGSNLPFSSAEQDMAAASSPDGELDSSPTELMGHPMDQPAEEDMAYYEGTAPESVSQPAPVDTSLQTRAEQVEWLAAALDPNLTGAVSEINSGWTVDTAQPQTSGVHFLVDDSTGEVTYRRATMDPEFTMDSEFAVSRGVWATDAYSELTVLVGDMVSTLTPPPPAWLVTLEMVDAEAFLFRATVEFVDPETGLIWPTWVLDYDDQGPVSFTGNLLD